jgi:hypothetical protein
MRSIGHFVKNRRMRHILLILVLTQFLLLLFFILSPLVFADD